MITKELLDEYFTGWDTGDIRWKKPTSKRIKVGDKAGWNHNDYLSIIFFGVRYKIHRLVFFYYNGFMPVEVDHINGNKIDNYIGNLRSANRNENSQNLKKRKNTSSKYLGVHFCKKTKKWKSQIYVNKRKIILGYFDTEEEAAEAYEAAKLEYHQFNPLIRSNAYDDV